ncbi:MAG: hypothetical protein AAF467_20325 [Actinomycetota bacterium]
MRETVMSLRGFVRQLFMSGRRVERPGAQQRPSAELASEQERSRGTRGEWGGGM